MHFFSSLILEFLTYLLKGLHEDVNLVTKKPSPFRFDEKAWDRMNDFEKSEEHWRMNLRTDNSRITGKLIILRMKQKKTTDIKFFPLKRHVCGPTQKYSKMYQM